VRPEDRDALQSNIDAAVLALAQVPADPHVNDDQEENKDIMIAAIIGAVVMVLMAIMMLFKWV